jgi:NAD(P)-dependent dehydrogenase (short-subunit alcohol dehydrogenase family)
MSLENKVALVTGGSRGIGRAIALRLARDGALVAINYANNDQAATEIVATIEHTAGKAFAIRASSAPKTKLTSCSETSMHKDSIDSTSWSTTRP